MSKTGRIYILRDPRNDEVRYVGLTTRPLTSRLSEHLYVARNRVRHTHCTCWILNLLEQGLKPVIEEVDTATVDELNGLEVYYIQKFKNDGAKLTNHTNGGKANFEVSPEARRKLSEAHKGKVLTDEHKENIARSQTGKRHSAKTKSKIAQWHTGKSLSETTRNKISTSRTVSGAAKGERNPNARLNKEQILDIYSRFQAGESVKDIAKVYAMRTSSINNILKGRSWKTLYEEFFLQTA